MSAPNASGFPKLSEAAHKDTRTIRAGARTGYAGARSSSLPDHRPVYPAQSRVAASPLGPTRRTFHTQLPSRICWAANNSLVRTQPVRDIPVLIASLHRPSRSRWVSHGTHLPVHDDLLSIDKIPPMWYMYVVPITSTCTKDALRMIGGLPWRTRTKIHLTNW